VSYTVRGSTQALVTSRLSLKECGNQLLRVVICGNEDLKKLSSFDVGGISFASEQLRLGGVFGREKQFFNNAASAFCVFKFGQAKTPNGSVCHYFQVLHRS
jgi:hypothetical protein